MATTFEPRTAYNESWQFAHAVEDVTYIDRAANGEQIAAYPAKLLMNGLRRADFQNRGEGVALSPNVPDGFLWLLPLDDGVSYPPPPKVDGAIERPEYGTELVITDVLDPRTAPYPLNFIEPLRNA